VPKEIACIIAYDISKELYRFVVNACTFLRSNSTNIDFKPTRGVAMEPFSHTNIPTEEPRPPPEAQESEFERDVLLANNKLLQDQNNVLRIENTLLSEKKTYSFIIVELKPGSGWFSLFLVLYKNSKAAFAKVREKNPNLVVEFAIIVELNARFPFLKLFKRKMSCFRFYKNDFYIVNKTLEEAKKDICNFLAEY
jgi:hypothetical protein